MTKKVYINRELPNKQQVAKYKSFNKVFGAYQKTKQSRASYKNRKYLLGVLLVLIVAALILWDEFGNKETDSEKNKKIESISSKEKYKKNLSTGNYVYYIYKDCKT